nr:5384_t:CDS:2 [Entrophospora candida]
MCFGTSSAVIKANIPESTNVEFPINSSQASEMKNFSGGAISEILPIRGGEVVPIVAARFIEICKNLKPFHGSSIRNLIFSFCNSLSDNKINGIIQSCPNIVYLNFNATGRLAISGTAIINIAHAYLNLLRLDLFECGYISNTAIRKIARLCPNLEYLNLGMFCLMSEDTVCIIAHSCQNLRYLGLMNCNNTEINDFEINVKE